MASNDTMVAPIAIGPLVANQVWPGYTRDRLQGEFMIRRIRAEIWAPQAGTLYLDVWDKEDKSDVSSTTFAVAAGATVPTDWVVLTKRFYGWRFVNGATAQNGIIAWEEKSGRPMTDVSVSGRSVIVDGTKNATAAGAPERICAASTPVGEGVLIQALDTNVGAVYVGSATPRWKLNKGDTVALGINDVYKLYLKADNAGDGINYMGAI